MCPRVIAAAFCGFLIVLPSDIMAGEPPIPAADSLSHSLSGTNHRVLPGIAQPKQRITVYPPTQGMIQELHVSEGQFVKSDQVLAILDDRVAQSAVVVAKAAAEQTGHIASALAEVVFASQQLHRLEALQGSGGISLHEIDNGKLTYDKSLANLKTARSEAQLAISKLRLEETRLETHRIRAPFDGQIVRLQLTEGQRVQDDTALMELVNVSILVAELYVPTKLYDQLVIGNTYELQADIPVNQRIKAVLTTRAPIVDAGTQTFRCLFEIHNPDGKFPAGFVVRVDHLVTGNADARQLTKN